GNNGVSSLRPVVIPSLHGAVSLTVGLQNFNVIMNDGRVLSSGYNEYGQTGLGFYSDGVLTPTEVPQWYNAQKVANGYYHSCALLANGDVSCVGRTQWHEFGIVLDGDEQALKIH